MFPDRPDLSLDVLSHEKLCEIPLSNNPGFSLFVRVYNAPLKTTNRGVAFSGNKVPHFLFFVKSKSDLEMKQLLNFAKVADPQALVLQDGSVFLSRFPQDNMPQLERILGQIGVTLTASEDKALDDVLRTSIRKRAEFNRSGRSKS